MKSPLNFSSYNIRLYYGCIVFRKGQLARTTKRFIVFEAIDTYARTTDS